MSAQSQESGNTQRGGGNTINLPVNITVTSLDPKQASAVILQNMPLIRGEIARSAKRGDVVSQALGRRR